MVEKPEFVMRLPSYAGCWMVEKTGICNGLPSWIRAARSGPG